MFKQENPNFVASKYAPNPLEVSYWIDLMADSSGNVIKSYTGEKWIPLNRDANVDQWTHIREIVESIGLTFDRDSDIISLPSFDKNNYFKGDSIIEAINNGDSAIKSEVDRLDDKIDAVDDDLQEFKSTKGQPGGLAELDNDGKVPASQLPSYVDDVVDVYATFDMSEIGMLDNIQLYKDPEHTIPVIGERDKIYINCTEGEPGYQFRWSGTQWVHIDSNALIIGEVPGTAFDGYKGKIAYGIANTIPDMVMSEGVTFDASNGSNIYLKYSAAGRNGEASYGKKFDQLVLIPKVSKTTPGVFDAGDYSRMITDRDLLSTINFDILSSASLERDTISNIINIPAFRYTTEDGYPKYTLARTQLLTLIGATDTLAGLMMPEDKVMVTSTLPDAIKDELIAREAAITALEAKDIELKLDITDLDTTVNADITTLRSTILKVNDATGLTEDNVMPDMSSTNYLNGSPSMVSSTVTLDHHLGVLQKSVQWTRLESARYAVNFNELFPNYPEGRYANKLVSNESTSGVWSKSTEDNVDWEIPSYKVNIKGLDTTQSYSLSPVMIYWMSGNIQHSLVAAQTDGEYVVPAVTIPYIAGESRIYNVQVGTRHNLLKDVVIEQVKL